MREGDGLRLDEIPPTLSALLKFLAAENNGIPVIDEKHTLDEQGREIIHVSNGLAYTKDAEGRWSVAPDS